MSYPKKKFIRAIVFLFLIGIIFLVVIGASSYFVLNDSSKYGMVVILLFGFFLYPLTERLVNWLDSVTSPTVDALLKDARSAKRGIDGEFEVSGWLEEIVGEGNILRNVMIPGRKFDIDFVVVGPKGVIVVEVKNFTNRVCFENDEYFQEKDGRRIPLSPDDDPRLEVKKHTFALSKYLALNGFDEVVVKKILVFSNGLVSWDGVTEVYIVKDKESLRKYLDDLKVIPGYAPEVYEGIKILLRK